MYTNIDPNTLVQIQNQVQLMMMIMPFIIGITIFDTILRAIALWKAGKNNQLPWFVCLFIFNTMGILPLIYIIIDASNNKKNKK